MVLEIEVQGAGRSCRDARRRGRVHPTPAREALRAQVIGRGTDGPEEVEARLRTAEGELEAQPEFAHVVVNDRLEQATQELIGIVRRAMECGTARR